MREARLLVSKVKYYARFYELKFIVALIAGPSTAATIHNFLRRDATCCLHTEAYSRYSSILSESFSHRKRNFSLTRCYTSEAGPSSPHRTYVGIFFTTLLVPNTQRCFISISKVLKRMTNLADYLTRMQTHGTMSSLAWRICLLCTRHKHNSLLTVPFLTQLLEVWEI